MRKYKVLEGGTRFFLEAYVNDHLEHGWELQGGVSMIYHPVMDEVWFYQAMSRVVEVVLSDGCTCDFQPGKFYMKCDSCENKANF